MQSQISSSKPSLDVFEGLCLAYHGQNADDRQYYATHCNAKSLASQQDRAIFNEPPSGHPARGVTLANTGEIVICRCTYGP
jgi:hypothetical protein